MRRERVVTLFGRADLATGSREYEAAREMGRLLAWAGLSVRTGGYGGAMEAASRGALEAGGRTEGVPCRAFAGRSPNGFLSETLWADDYFGRIRLLMEGACGFVAMDPRAGTLAEVTTLWAMSKADLLKGSPMVLVGGEWARIVSFLKELGTVDRNLLQCTSIAPGPQEALAFIRQGLRPTEEDNGYPRQDT
jgi:uncharacterized protein (TIGR00725 family)